MNRKVKEVAENYIFEVLVILFVLGFFWIDSANGLMLWEETDYMNSFDLGIGETKEVWNNYVEIVGTNNNYCVMYVNYVSYILRVGESEVINNVLFELEGTSDGRCIINAKR